MERFGKGVRYHEAIRHNGILYLSGVTATDAGDTIRTQARSVLAKIEDMLNKYGSSKDCILHADIYLRDSRDVGAFNEEWDRWICREMSPTRALIVTKLGREPILVEIVVTAAYDDRI
ncbi:MAG: RidA family protein [Clostridia bacterium]|nr:RidA family protein [Clostridia bacterium]